MPVRIITETAVSISVVSVLVQMRVHYVASDKGNEVVGDGNLMESVEGVEMSVKKEDNRIVRRRPNGNNEMVRSEPMESRSTRGEKEEDIEKCTPGRKRVKNPKTNMQQAQKMWQIDLN